MTEKLKVYLDTNMVYDIFQRKTLALLNRGEYRITKKIEFLERNQDKIIAYTSFFTLIEVIDRLKRDFNPKSTIILEELRFFRNNYKVKILEAIKITGETLQWILQGVSWKDAIQLNIAKNKHLIFVTDDINLFNFSRKINIRTTNFKGLQDLVFRYSK